MPTGAIVAIAIVLAAVFVYVIARRQDRSPDVVA
jgi:hypothetical protein